MENFYILKAKIIASVTLFLLLIDCSESPKQPNRDFFESHAAKTLSISMDTSSLNGKKKWVGSGFLISEDGLALTCLHVIADTKPFVVRVGGEGKRFFAKLIAEDRDKDLALIKLDAKESFSYFPLRLNQSVDRGDIYFTISSPYGLEDSLSTGIVSDPIRIEIDYNVSNLSYVQTGSPILEGSSGAALISENGSLIGMAQFQWRNPNWNQAGIGFALRTIHLKEFVGSIKNTSLSTADLQAGIVEIPIVTDHLVQKLNLPTNKGLLVSYVIENSSADIAGIKRYDFIIRVENQVVTQVDDFVKSISNLKVNEKVSIHLIRDGKEKTVELVRNKTQP